MSLATAVFHPDFQAPENHVIRASALRVGRLCFLHHLEWINIADARPPLPEDMITALKFGACLLASVTAAVLAARTAVADVVAEILSRPIRLLRA